MRSRKEMRSKQQHYRNLLLDSCKHATGDRQGAHWLPRKVFFTRTPRKVARKPNPAQMQTTVKEIFRNLLVSGTKTPGEEIYIRCSERNIFATMPKKYICCNERNIFAAMKEIHL